MLQLGFGESAAKSGTVTFMAAIGALAMKPLAQPLLRRFGFRDAMIWIGLLSVLFTAICAAFRPGWPIAALDAVLLVGECSARCSSPPSTPSPMPTCRDRA